MTATVLYGEPLSLLLKAILQMNFVSKPDGSVTVDAELDQRLGEPFVRALKRVEAQLLLEETDGAEIRKDRARDEERAMRAFTVLVADAVSMLNAA